MEKDVEIRKAAEDGLLGGELLGRRFTESLKAIGNYDHRETDHLEPCKVFPLKRPLFNTLMQTLLSELYDDFLWTPIVLTGPDGATLEEPLDSIDERQRVHNIARAVRQVYSQSHSEIVDAKYWTQIWTALGHSGIQILLKHRLTRGTATDVLCPDPLLLIRSFSLPTQRAAARMVDRPPVDGSNLLTVGTKAFSKHAHRDSSTQWWGTCTGDVRTKNRIALDRLTQIIKESVWMNIHSLPHGLRVLELRVIEGYG
ncbi:hypothetical protein BJ742DRAFT_317623 [Cladochytrium replicatum]|nr:hypothetical protein BJ742DRAFT_317623 [Cladochytrium replicatum]